MILIKKKYIVIIFTFLILMNPLSLFYFDKNTNGRKLLKKISYELRYKAADDELPFFYNISDYIKHKIQYSYRDKKLLGFNIYYYPFKPFFIMRPNQPSSEATLILKKGACGEIAELFKGITETNGYKTRVVHNPSEDHAWNEIMINDMWIQYDVSTKWFNDTNSYERSRDSGGWGKNISTVFYIDTEGNRHYITGKYTDTGTLIIKVKNNGRPVKNAQVKVLSKFLMESERWGNTYQSPLLAARNNTSVEGNCEFKLGANNYVIEVTFNEWIIFPREKKVELVVTENKKIKIVIDF